MNKHYGTTVELLILIKKILIFSKCCWAHRLVVNENLLLEAIKFMSLLVTFQDMLKSSDMGFEFLKVN